MQVVFGVLTCPTCKKDLDFLVLAKSKVECVPFYIQDGYAVLGLEPYDVPVDVIEDYCCPSCLWTVCHTEEEAKKILAGTDLSRSRPPDVPYIS